MKDVSCHQKNSMVIALISSSEDRFIESQCTWSNNMFFYCLNDLKEMVMKKEDQSYTIWIEAEEWAPGTWTPKDDNTDVIVTYQDGRRWVASFFSYQNIAALTEKNKRTGECLSGAYFWASGMLLIDFVSRQSIEEVVDHLMKEGDFEAIFTYISPEDK